MDEPRLHIILHLLLILKTLLSVLALNSHLWVIPLFFFCHYIQKCLEFKI